MFHTVYKRRLRSGSLSFVAMDLEDYARLVSRDDVGVLEYFQDHGMLRRQVVYGSCQKTYSQIKDKRCIVTPFVLRCSGCRRKKKITADTMFEGSRLPLRKLFGLMYMWAYSIPVMMATSLLGVSSVTVVQWFQYFR